MNWVDEMSFCLFKMMEFYERVSGARMHAAYVRPGGVALVSFSFDYVKVYYNLWQGLNVAYVIQSGQTANYSSC